MRTVAVIRAPNGLRRWNCHHPGEPGAALRNLMHLLRSFQFLVVAVAVPFPPMFAATAEVVAAATGDGRTIVTSALQGAIDEVHQAGGGVVHIPAGTYLTGTLELRSGVTLNLAAGATILGSPKLSDYRRGHWPALLMARDQSNIGVVGEGTIDGNSPALVKEFERIQKTGSALEFFPGATPGNLLDVIGPTGVPTQFDPYALEKKGKLKDFVYGTMNRPNEFVRPQVIEFWGCTGVTVRGITLKNAACWVETYRDCEDVRIERIKVRSTGYWNNDGIDIVDCRRVSITDSDIDSADDALCLKSDPRGEGCADITIARCTLSSRANALKFGSASHHTFVHIRASNLVVHDTNNSAVAIESVDGALVDDVVVEHVRATNTGNAFFVRLGHRTRSKPPGIIRGVTLRDMDVEIRPSRPGARRNPIPASIVGVPEEPVSGVLVQDVRVRYPGCADCNTAVLPLTALDSIAENVKDYPEYSMWGELPAWAVYIRHARGVMFQNVQFTLATSDRRPAIVADDAAGLTVDNLTIGSGGGEPIVAVRNAPDMKMTNPQLPAGTREFIRNLSSPASVTSTR